MTKRPQVHQLDGCPRDRDLPSVGVGAQLRRKHREKRSKRGAAGVDKVRHRVAHNLVGLGEFAIDQLCNPGNPVVDVGGELRVTQADCRDHARGRRHAHNIDTCTR